MRTLVAIALAMSLAGCDLAGTAVATGAGASSELKQAQQAKQTEDHVRQQVEQLNAQHHDQINQAEKDPP